jgi:gliding motility associated protien GldN
MKFLSFLLLYVGLTTALFAQPDTIVNQNSVEKIPYYEQLYRFRVWRTVDLNEKQNAGFKSAKSDISQFLLQSIKSGSITVYNDSLTTVMTPEQVTVSNKANMEAPYDAKKSYFINEPVSYNGKNYESTRNDNKAHLPTDADWWQVSANQTEYFTKDNVVGIELVEDVIFDKRRSRLYYDPQAIGLLAQKSGSTDMSPIGYIKYKDFYDLVEKAFHSKDMTVRDKVMWRNRYNPSENRSFVDAFKLRLFHGVILKVENPGDYSIEQIYTRNGRTYGESVFARWEEEMKMMEKEHNLWEY